MANTNQARKRARQAVARNQHLSAQRSQYRTAIKSVRKFIVAGDKAGAIAAYEAAVAALPPTDQESAAFFRSRIASLKK